MIEQILHALARTLLVESPNLLVLLAAIILALARISRHPGPAKCIAAGAGVLILLLFIGPLMYRVVNALAGSGGRGSYVHLRDGMTFLLNLVRAAAWALLLAALFGWRRPVNGVPSGAQEVPRR